ncbi:MAG: 50S ribosomal protein L5 [Patescibacteria group bacterium]
MLKSKYQELVPTLKSELNLHSSLAVPRLVKVVLNAGVGSRAQADSKLIDQVAAEFANITGQKPIITKAKKSIAGFKLREGMPVGVTVTLRGAKMYDFLERLINITLPRVRDFQGLDLTGFDTQGNYNIGIKEHTVFPEVTFEATEKNFSFQITVVTTAKSKEATKLLLQSLGFPFKKDK